MIEAGFRKRVERKALRNGNFELLFDRADERLL